MRPVVNRKLYVTPQIVCNFESLVSDITVDNSKLCSLLLHLATQTFNAAKGVLKYYVKLILK